MGNYAKYGTSSSFMNILSEEELNNITSNELVNLIHSITAYKHRILYYGPSSLSNLNENLSNLHKSTTALNLIAKNNKFEELEINTNTVYVLDYDMKQAEVLFLAKGSKFQADDIQIISFHNSYFYYILID